MNWKGASKEVQISSLSVIYLYFMKKSTLEMLMFSDLKAMYTCSRVPCIIENIPLIYVHCELKQFFEI